MSTFIHIWSEYPLPLSAFIIGLEASCAASNLKPLSCAKCAHMSKISLHSETSRGPSKERGKLQVIFLDTRFPFSHQTHLSGGWTAAVSGFTYGATYYSFYFAQF